ncbi:SH3 domain protein [Ancylostoma duodenale]|uniref:SH3 domain protein n=1 Tax=Ancylostoma duodenale TaxID=51022 RepID=A0A0C2CNR6_9BILA|nr:SH3 domain protein [Ancylostoma duodenale]
MTPTPQQDYVNTELFRVIHDFDATEPKFLTLRKGDRLTLVDVIGEDRGWWKGQIADRVRLLSHSSFLAFDDFYCSLLDWFLSTELRGAMEGMIITFHKGVI